MQCSLLSESRFRHVWSTPKARSSSGTITGKRPAIRFGRRDPSRPYAERDKTELVPALMPPS
jgi:hypothetical protein